MTYITNLYPPYKNVNLKPNVDFVTKGMPNKIKSSPRDENDKGFAENSYDPMELKTTYE